jgi:hypothetical protein
MNDVVLTSANVLVLEDDALINLNTTETIQAMGCVVHPFFATVRRFCLHFHEPA